MLRRCEAVSFSLQGKFCLHFPLPAHSLIPQDWGELSARAHEKTHELLTAVAFYVPLL